jgi:hypothetical protein
LSTGDRHARQHLARHPALAAAFAAVVIADAALMAAVGA